MKALVYHGAARIAWEEHPEPALRNAGDAIVRMLTTTICGANLDILRGGVPTCTPGRVLGHEGVGVIESVGAGVAALRPGDHVLISGLSRCANCGYCRRGMFSHCPTGGWKLGNTVDGTQAEYVRVPHAQTSLYAIDAGADEAALAMLGAILPGGFEWGVLGGKVALGARDTVVDGGRWLIDRVSTPMSLTRVAVGAIAPPRPGPRRLKFRHMLEAYAVFGRAGGASRVIVEA